MYTEAKKLNLIEKVLKIKNEAVLNEIEAVVDKAEFVEKESKPSAHDFSGVLSKKDALLMEAAIEEGSEQVNPDGWK